MPITGCRFSAVMKLRDPGVSQRPESIYRQHRVENALDRIDGPIDWAHVKAALADEFGKPGGVLRTPRPEGFSSISATVATTLMDAAQRVMWVARKPYEARSFQEYTL